MSGAPSNANGRAADRLPPPAFPRGRRRWRVPAPPPDAVTPEVPEIPEPSEVPEASHGPGERLNGPLPDDVVVLPWEDGDEPVPPGHAEAVNEEAFISPDTPVIRLSPPTVPEDFEEVMGRGQSALDVPSFDPMEDVELGPQGAAWEDMPVRDEVEPEGAASADVPIDDEVEPEGAAWEDVPVGAELGAEGAAEVDVPKGDGLEPVGDDRETDGVNPVWDGEADATPVALGEPVEPAVVEEDPGLQVLVAAVQRLADDLTSRGEEALGTEAALSPFEATLRAYCVGYLEGLRDLASPDPDTPARHEDPGITSR